MMVADGVGSGTKGTEASRIGSAGRVRTHEDFENWDKFAPRYAVGMHAVDRQGIVLWAKIWKALKEQWEKQCAA
jgi:hypothetical protein